MLDQFKGGKNALIPSGILELTAKLLCTRFGGDCNLHYLWAIENYPLEIDQRSDFLRDLKHSGENRVGVDVRLLISS